MRRAHARPRSTLLSLALACAALPGTGSALASGTPAAATTTSDAAPREPIPVLDDADRRAAFPVTTAHPAHDDAVHAYWLVDRLEAWNADDGSGLAWEAEAWIGKDRDRLWLRADGERSDGATEAAGVEVLYGRAIAPWWDLVAGLRHDTAPGDARTSAVFGVRGLAPMKFEVDAMLRIDGDGHASAHAEASYELLLSNRLVLQPLLEVTLQGRDDPARGVASGVSTMEAGLRLRYEVTRRFAPYVGLAHERAFGDTADLRAMAGEDRAETRVVAGIRFWY